MGRVYALIIAVFCTLPALFGISCKPPDISITSLQVVPSSIAAGQTAVLQWNVAGTAEVTINNGIGGQPPYGKLEVSPAQTTTYTLSAANGSRSVQGTVTLTVNTPPSAPPVATMQMPSVPALDTQALFSHMGEQVRVEGDVTYISSWLPTRFRGQGTTEPWTFIFFMKDVWEGAADNAGGGEYCPECWRDYTSYFRGIIPPGYLSHFLPVFNSYFGGGFALQQQGLIIGVSGGRLIYLPNPNWGAGYVVQGGVHAVIRGVVDNYLSAPAVYLTQPGQLSFSQP